MEQTIKISVLNELMSSSTQSKYRISSKDGHRGVPDGGEGYQGEYNERFEFYRHPDMPENVFLQITYQSDSYGDNESIYEMKLVKGREKTITVYEPIN